MKRFIQSLKHAVRGLRTVYREEANFRIHTVVGMIVVVVGGVIGLDLIEWAMVIFAIGLVLLMEVINSLVERILDIIKPTTNEYVREMKDMMASAVVIVALVSIVIGGMVFIPKIIHTLF